MKTKYVSVLFVGPALIVMNLLGLFPLIYSFYVSFHRWILVKPHLGFTFVGLGNYIKLFSDPVFLHSLGVTVHLTAVAVGSQFGLGFGIALLTNVEVRKYQPIKGVRIMRTALLIPYMLMPVTVGTIWRMLYDPRYGLINYFLGLVGIPPRTWVGDPTLALYSIAVADTWQCTAFIMLITIAGLKALPRWPYEAASIDGASVWQTFRYITLPLLKPVLLVAIVMRLIDAFRIFDKIMVLTYGGPGETTLTLSVFTYRTGFAFYKMGYASAASYIMLAIVLVISLVFFNWLYGEG